MQQNNINTEIIENALWGIQPSSKDLSSADLQELAKQAERELDSLMIDVEHIEEQNDFEFTDELGDAREKAENINALVERIEDLRGEQK